MLLSAFSIHTRAAENQRKPLTEEGIQSLSVVVGFEQVGLQGSLKCSGWQCIWFHCPNDDLREVWDVARMAQPWVKCFFRFQLSMRGDNGICTLFTHLRITSEFHCNCETESMVLNRCAVIGCHYTAAKCNFFWKEPCFEHTMLTRHKCSCVAPYILFPLKMNRNCRT